MTRRYDAVIVGGGHNGLVCAFYLARAGLKVRVLERRHVVGGAAVTEEIAPGFRASIFSYLMSLLHPRIIRDWPDGAFSTNLFWNRAMDAGRMWGVVHQGLWFDVGTPPAIGRTEAMLAEG